VLLRPVIEAALFPTLAASVALGRWRSPESAAVLEARCRAPGARPALVGLTSKRVDKVLSKHGLTPADFNGQSGA
jgi:hypothetical protein